MQPAPYSNTDAEEQDAINIFKTCINTKRVKEDIRTRDKYPNIDGTLEIVNTDRIPVGKLDVQIRKIPNNALQYSCPVSLVEYSKVSTLPVILVCVDVSNSRAFWKSIYPSMPEYKENQASFTVHFNEHADKIAGDEKYLRSWLSLIDDYKDRISHYPALKKEFASKVTVDSVSATDKELFQKYIDRINYLLDSEFVCIKNLLLPDVWKLGVGVFGTNDETVAYQLYKIEYGSTAPLLCALEGTPFDFNSKEASTFSSHWSTRSHFGDPDKAGEAFVLAHVRKAVEERRLSIHGKQNCNNVLFRFLDSHGHCLGVDPNQNSYDISDLERGLTEYLPGISARIALDVTNETSVVLDFDMVSQFARDNKLEPIPPSDIPIQVTLHCSQTPLKQVFESIRYFSANQVPTIRRILKPRSHALSSGASWIWSGFSESDVEHNVLSILTHSLDEYSAFTVGNKLKLGNSMYLDENITIVFTYEHPQEDDQARGPVLQEYFIDNSDRSLPKQIISLNRKSDPIIIPTTFPEVSIDDVIYKVRSWSTIDGAFLFQRTPQMNMTYRMLCKDLEYNYDIKHVSGQ